MPCFISLIIEYLDWGVKAKELCWSACLETKAEGVTLHCSVLDNLSRLVVISVYGMREDWLRELEGSFVFVFK